MCVSVVPIFWICTIQKHTSEIQAQKAAGIFILRERLVLRQEGFLHLFSYITYHASHITHHASPSTPIAAPSYLQTNLLPLHTPNHDPRRILRDHLIIMQHLKLLARIFPHVTEQRLRSARVLVQPVRHIQHHPLHHDPQIVLFVVFGDLVHAEGLLGDLEIDGVGRFGHFAGVGAVGSTGHDGAGGLLGLRGLGFAAHG